MGGTVASTIILPGGGGSDEAHWQTLWEAHDPDMVRFQPASWEAPDLGNWLLALDRAIVAASAPPLLVAHSLSCLLIAHWAARDMEDAGRRVRGAFLVGVPDPDSPDFPAALASFQTESDRRLPFPTLVVASTDDRYATLAHARRRAVAWGAGFVSVGALGHINSASGLGDWSQGLMLLEAFRAGTARP